MNPLLIGLISLGGLFLVGTWFSRASAVNG